MPGAETAPLDETVKAGEDEVTVKVTGPLLPVGVELVGEGVALSHGAREGRALVIARAGHREGVGPGPRVPEVSRRPFPETV